MPRGLKAEELKSVYRYAIDLKAKRPLTPAQAASREKKAAREAYLAAVAKEKVARNAPPPAASGNFLERMRAVQDADPRIHKS
jgi:hypothetical protein